MRLELTRRTDLALKALRHLQADTDRTTAAELAQALNTSAGFLHQVMTPAVRAGWVDSVVGPAGGYALSTSAEAVSVLDVVEASEGPVDDGRCALAGTPCPSPVPCALHDAWVGARAALLDVLAATPVLHDVAALQLTTADPPAPRRTGAPVTGTERT